MIYLEASDSVLYKIYIGEPVKFLLTQFSLCPGHTDGSMQQTTENQWLKEQETRAASEAPSNIGTFVIDDMFFLQLLKDLLETFGLIATSILIKHVQ